MQTGTIARTADMGSGTTIGNAEKPFNIATNTTLPIISVRNAKTLTGITIGNAGKP